MSSRHLGLPLLAKIASVLSGEYGVKVVSEGTEAYTEYPLKGKPVIHIPAVEIDDADYLTLVRGFVDHEAGHIRFSRVDPATRGRQRCENPGALTLIFNIYEDVYIDRMMAQCFPGSRRNISDLVWLLYAERRNPPLNVYQFAATQWQLPRATVAAMLWSAILQYMRYFIRSRELPALEQFVPDYQDVLDRLLPGIVPELEAVLLKAQAEGVSTQANRELAKEALEIVLRYFQDNGDVVPGSGQGDGEEELELDGSGEGEAGDSDLGMEDDREPSELEKAMKEAAGGSGAGGKSCSDLSAEASEIMGDMARSAKRPQPEAFQIVEQETHAWKAQVERLDRSDLDAAVRVMASLDAQLQTLIQNLVMKRGPLSRAGRLDTNMLHRLASSNPRVFRKQEEKYGINAEIILIADMSGSMLNDDKYIMTSRALYAIAASLRKIPGVLSSVIGFSGDKIFNILGPHDPLTTRMRLIPTGQTLCGEALSYATQHFSGALDTRKIIFMLTDGKAHNNGYFEDMIRRTKASGVEFLGIGIMDDSILDYFSPEECCVVRDLKRLAPEMFRMLRNKLMGAQ